MIEVNLLPSGRKRRARRGRSFSFSLPQFKGFGGGGGADRWVLAVVAVAILTLGVGAWLWLGVSSDRARLDEELAQAVQDSARYADLIAQTTELEARRDSILERVAVIQEIDRDRLIWPHILDEVARALPEYTWLTEITTISSNPVVFQLIGRAGNTRAITLFMEQLQASPFVQSVRLLTSQAVVENQNTAQQQVVQSFELEVEYEPVPLEDLTTVPLFVDGEVGGTDGESPSAAPGEIDAVEPASDTTGAAGATPLDAPDEAADFDVGAGGAPWR